MQGSKGVLTAGTFPDHPVWIYFVMTNSHSLPSVTVWRCEICDKPFTKGQSNKPTPNIAEHANSHHWRQESSHKRHIPYCRRNQSRPRIRPKSCRLCSAAKVKCTFQTPCLRCASKGIDCVYELPCRSHAVAEDSEAATSSGNSIEQAVPGLCDPSTFIQDSSDEPRTGPAAGEVFQVPLMSVFPSSAADVDDVIMDLLSLPTDEPATYGFDESLRIGTVSTESTTDKTIPFDTWAWPHASIQPRMGQAAQEPWSAWTTSVSLHPAPTVSNLIQRFSLPRVECLVPLRASGAAAQHSTQFLIRALRAYPLMMLRRETLPPFIHPHWCRQGTPSLPEPISNCMSIAHMYASRSEETRSFLWRTVKAENEWFLEQVTNCLSSSSCLSLRISNADLLSTFPSLFWGRIAHRVLTTGPTGSPPGTDDLYDYAVCRRGNRASRLESANGHNVPGQPLVMKGLSTRANRSAVSLQTIQEDFQLEVLRARSIVSPTNLGGLDLCGIQTKVRATYKSR